MSLGFYYVCPLLKQKKLIVRLKATNLREDRLNSLIYLLIFY